MSQQPFERWHVLMRKMQEPLQDIAELNFKTMQDLSFLRTNELNHIRKPEELLEKQINLAIENGHKALDYMQKSFEIIEKAMTGFVKEGKKSATAEGRKFEAEGIKVAAAGRKAASAATGKSTMGRGRKAAAKKTVGVKKTTASGKR